MTEELTLTELAAKLKRHEAIHDEFNLRADNVLKELKEVRENLLTLNRDERMGIIHGLDECMADMADFDLNRRAAELQMSKTLNSIAKSAASIPLDPGNPEDLKAGLSTSLVDFCEAMDRDEFSFHTRKAAASVVGLACIAFCLVHGQPEFEQATAH